MKLRLLTLLVLATSSFATDASYLAKMIECEPKDEFLLSQTYEAFLTLISKREVKEESIRFPAHLAIRNDGGVVLSRAFYISPNELRGFELSIPNDCYSERNGILISTTALSVEREETKQGIRCLVLKKKMKTTEPNQALEPTNIRRFGRNNKK